LRRFQLVLLLLALAIVLISCAKEKKAGQKTGGNPVPTPTGGTGGGTARGQFVKNLAISADLKEWVEWYGITDAGGICAQQMIPNSGQFKDKNVVELSQGPCPSNGLTGEGVRRDVLEIYEGWFSTSLYDANENEVGTVSSSEVTELCSGDTYQWVCYLDAGTDAKYHGIYIY
jgi:hypothetical protein